MKVAIPVVDLNQNKNRIAGGLNVLGQICIFDSVKDESIWQKTLDLASDMGQLLLALERQDVSIIITRQVQPMALKVLVNKGFVVYKSIGDELEANIRFLSENVLIPFDMVAAKEFATVCGGECTVCETECADDKK